MTHHLTAAAMAEIKRWESDGRSAVTNVVASAVEHLDNGASPAMVADVIARSAITTDPERVATGFGWAVVALAEQTRKAAS